ncbi:MAG: hypothetical protein JNJ48_04950 [Phycisphaerae bacterium]|nr:hypothetical protein [Phycisphaerae bacterium]
MSRTTSPKSAVATGPATVLTASERAAAAELGRRLATELRGLLAHVPTEHHGASALGRYLRLDRNTCQRVIASTAGDDHDEAVLVRLPGIEGLGQFVDAVEARIRTGAVREQVAAVRAAVGALERLIDRLGGSQRRLRQRLEADLERSVDSAAAPADNAARRQALFRSAAEVVGRWSEAVVSVVMIRPVPGRPELTEGVRTRAYVGHTWRPGAVPLEIGESSVPQLALERDESAHQSLEHRPARGDSPDLLLGEFCSQPWPRVTSRALGDRTVHVVDAGEPPHQGTCDIVLSVRRSSPDRHPALASPPVGEVSFLVTFPARRLVLDVFLHRDLAERCVPSCELHLYSPAVGPGGLARWSTRLPGGASLDPLGSGLRRAASTAYARHAELTAHVFQRVGWDASEFVGYRCDTSYPVWRAGYFMLFDFAPPPGAGGA